MAFDAKTKTLLAFLEAEAEKHPAFAGEFAQISPSLVVPRVLVCRVFFARLN